METILRITSADKVGDTIVAQLGEIVCLEEIKSNSPSGFPGFLISGNGNKIWCEEKHPHIKFRRIQ